MAGSSPSDDHPIGSVREVFFERLVPNRECGDCVACCKILEIKKPDLQKPADVLCPHNTGIGCSIYSTRPSICRTWYCLWRRIDELPEFTRPDKIGVVFSVDRHSPPRTPFERLYIVARALHSTSDFEHPAASAAIQMFVDEGSLPVWTSVKGNKTLIHPHQELAIAIMNPSASPPHLLDQVRIWRKRLALD